MQNAVSKNLLSFIKNSPSPFHAVASIVKILKREGFEELIENNPFSLKLGGKYYVVRNETSIIAFKLPRTLDNYSFNIVASHCDSPCFKVKPIADFPTNGYSRLNVEGYGGMLCATWFDRPLSIAGRLIVSDNDRLESKLVSFDKNLASICSLPIHFNREANDGYKYNMSVDMFPTISEEKISFKDLLKKEFEVDGEILNYDLFLYNRQDGYFWGQSDEFISSAKLDDLQCAYTTLLGFIKAFNNPNVSVYCCFDNEEVGSLTRQGANSTFLEDVLERITLSLCVDKEKHHQALAKSFMVSADNAHAVSPNHPELTDQYNNVYMNKGIVIKFNAAQSYTSDSISSSIFMQICKKANVPYQIFTNKSGIRGGGTLGNISGSHVSVSSVDIGIAMLAMHSAMETSGTIDNEYMVKAIKEYYESFLEIENNTKIQIKKETIE